MPSALYASLDTPEALLAWAQDPDRETAAELARCVVLRNAVEYRHLLLSTINNLDDPGALQALEAHRVELGMLIKILGRTR